MKYYYLAFALFLISCAGNYPPPNESNEKEIITIPNRDSLSHIGFINDFYFSDKNEIYAEIFTKGYVDTWEEHDSISKLAKERIYQDDENSRNVFSLSEAKANFDLRGLDKLWLYDTNHVEICRVNLKSIEYLNQLISPAFIAVYDTPTKISPENTYCIGGIKPKFDDVSIERAQDSASIIFIDNSLKKSGITTNYKHEHHQYKINDNIIITITNTDQYDFIHKTDGERISLIYEYEEFENIIHSQFIPIMKYGLPMLLCELIVPETDVFWTELFVYDGERYKSQRRQKVKFK